MSRSLDLKSAISMLEEAVAVCRDLQGRSLDDIPKTKDRPALKAETSRLIGLAAHYADAGRLEINSQFYRFKGEQNLPEMTLGN